MAETRPAAIKPPLQQKAPEPEAGTAPEAPAAPIEEVVNIAGVVLKNTIYPGGEVETEILREPRLSKEDIAATRAMQRRKGR